MTGEEQDWRRERMVRPRHLNHDIFDTANITNHTVEFDPFIKSQLASHNQFESLMWCKLGHVTHQNLAHGGGGAGLTASAW